MSDGASATGVWARFAAAYLRDLGEIVADLDAEALGEAISWLRAAAAAGRTIYTCGNGGSSSIASQMVVDLLKGATAATGTPHRAFCLSDNVPALTAYANDASYESVFVEPLRTLAVPGDVLVAISVSGNSGNVLRAVDYANGAGLRTIGLTASSGGRLESIAARPLLVPGSHVGRLEDAFFLMTHTLVFGCMETG